MVGIINQDLTDDQGILNFQKHKVQQDELVLPEVLPPDDAF